MGVNAAKGAGALVIFGVSWMDHIFSPLIWGLLILFTLDMVLNVHKGIQHQLTKIGSGFASLGGISLLKVTNLFSQQNLHYMVAIMVLVYLQIVVPQLVAFIGGLKFISPIEKAGADAAIETESSKLQDAAQMNMPSPGTKS